MMTTIPAHLYTLRFLHVVRPLPVLLSTARMVMAVVGTKEVPLVPGIQVKPEMAVVDTGVGPLAVDTQVDTLDILVPTTIKIAIQVIQATATLGTPAAATMDTPTLTILTTTILTTHPTTTNSGMVTVGLPPPIHCMTP